MKMRSTPAGEHRPVLLAEVLAALDPRPGDIAVDCTVGYAAQLLATLPEADLARAFTEFGDEPRAEIIAAAIAAERGRRPLNTTRELRDLIQRFAPVTIAKPGPGVPKPWQQKVRPVARVFQ